jgi:hypothetical protein
MVYLIFIYIYYVPIRLVYKKEIGLIPYRRVFDMQKLKSFPTIDILALKSIQRVACENIYNIIND